MGVEAFLTVADAAKRWGLSVRRVQSYCVDGRIAGAEKWGRAWMLPADSHCPSDARLKGSKTAAARQPYIRESPLIAMTDLLTLPGSADEANKSILSNRGTLMFGAYIEYMRGNIDATHDIATRCLAEDTHFYAQLSATTLVSLCAMYRGDTLLWKASRERMRNVKCRNDSDYELLTFWLAASDSAIYGDGGYPEWFCRGRLERLPADSQPAARFFYIKHIFLQCMNSLRDTDGVDAESIHRIGFIPYIAEPLIAQTRMEGVFVAEIYLRLICAICYHTVGDDSQAVYHIDTAISLALPDKLYAPLAEYRINLDHLLDDRLRARDDNAYQTVKQINRRMSEGWVALYNNVFDKNMTVILTTREREAARLAVMGLNNREISHRQHVSVSTVKQSLRLAMQKTGAKNRTELAKYI